VFGRLDEELDAVTEAEISYEIVPGITAGSAAAASLGQSLTKRGRNSELRFLTGHDVKGFADHDWRSLARPGSVAAIYMAKKGARFLQGRMLMHGADGQTPVTVVENASRADQRTVTSTLDTLWDDLNAADLSGPAILMLGLAPRAALQAAQDITEVREHA
jgi:siroheme synthase